MSWLFNWALAAAGVAIFFAAIAVATPNEEQDVADEAGSAWIDPDNRAKRDAIAHVLCESELGPGTHVLWTRDGDLVCRPAATRVAQGGTK